jgi:hypothetical protein
VQWIEVQSSAITALAYDARACRLGIEFQQKRKVYFYYDVPPSEFEAFLAAESKGRYLSTQFLPKNYRCTGPYPSRRLAPVRNDRL